MNEEGVIGLPAIYRNELEARASDRQLRGAGYRDVGLEGRDIAQLEALAEEALGESLRSADRARDFLVVVRTRVDLQARVQASEIAMAADVVPMRMRHNDRRQLRQAGRVGSQRRVSRHRRVGTRARVDSYQLPPVLRHDEVILGELEAG